MTPNPDDHLSKEELLTATRRIVEEREAKEASVSVPKSPPKKAAPQKIDWSSQGALVFGGILGAIIVLYALLGMCRSEKPPRRALTEVPPLPETIEYGGQTVDGQMFTGMETTWRLKDDRLVEEIQQVADAGGLPIDVFADDVPSEMNIANGLNRLFGVYKDNPGELKSLREGVAVGEWGIAEETLKQVSDVLTRVEPKRQDIRSMLKQDDVCFAFEFTDSAQGQIPETDGADFMEDYVLLEEYAIARALLEGKADDAVESLAYIFRIAQLAAEVRSPEVRSKAARIRRRALDITQTVVLDANFRKHHLVDLYEILKEQLEHWTDDAEAWIGDRASGLKVYNLIAQFGPEEALLEHEVAELRLRGILDALPEAVATPPPRQRRNLLFGTRRQEPPQAAPRRSNLGEDFVNNLAEDQVFYLRTMRSIIDECRKPYYQRQDLLNRTYADLRQQRNSSEGAVIAEMLLRGIPPLMEYIAFDRTECEVAFLAMSASLQRSLPPGQFELDPLSGKKYETLRMLNPTEPRIPIVRVGYANSLKPFRVPDYASGE